MSAEIKDRCSCGGVLQECWHRHMGITEASKRLGICLQTFRRWVRKKEGFPQPMNGRPGGGPAYWCAEEIELFRRGQFVKARERSPVLNRGDATHARSIKTTQHLLNCSQVARELGVSRQTVKKLEGARLLPPVLCGDGIRWWARADVERVKSGQLPKEHHNA